MSFVGPVELFFFFFPARNRWVCECTYPSSDSIKGDGSIYPAQNPQYGDYGVGIYIESLGIGSSGYLLKFLYVLKVFLPRGPSAVAVYSVFIYIRCSSPPTIHCHLHLHTYHNYKTIKDLDLIKCFAIFLSNTVLVHLSCFQDVITISSILLKTKHDVP